MNKYQIEVEKHQLENEKQTLEELKINYAKALADVKGRIKELSGEGLTQSKIYQLQYQETLERQLQAIIDLLGSDNVKSINDFLIRTYEDGFIGTLYNMQNEGIPFVMAINQEAVVKSVRKKTGDFQLSKTMYKNAEELKKVLKSEITRGISQGLSYSIISRRIASHSEADLKKAYRIARTEGGRVQSEAKFECMRRAKSNGADVVKEWDSVIDKRTRQSHAKLDGQIREIEEPFCIDGHKAMYPHNFGIAEEDINCRCVVLERARWAIDENESFSKNIDGDMVEFKNVKDYVDFKKKYFDFYEKSDTIEKIEEEVKKDVQYIGKLNLQNIGELRDIAITDEVILTDERLNEHILVKHQKEYEQLKPYLKEIIEYPDIVMKDNIHKDTIILLRKISEINKNGRVVVKIAIANDEKHPKNSIITLMKLNDRTWKQTLRNRGDVIFEKK